MVPLSSLPAGYTLITGTWAECKIAARAVRHAVFVVEQQIPIEIEWDAWDEPSLHALVLDANRLPIGTGRLLPASFDTVQPETAHIGRMAVLANVRRGGVGGVLLQSLMAAARHRGFLDIVLHAQSYVAPFYARHGYVVEGDEFMEAGIAHRTMRTSLRLPGKAPAA